MAKRPALDAFNIAHEDDRDLLDDLLESKESEQSMKRFMVRLYELGRHRGRMDKPALVSVSTPAPSAEARTAEQRP